MQREIQSFVRRSGKMSNGQKRAYEELHERWCITYREKRLDFSSLFRDKKVVLEIGFGMGDATWQIAQNNPETEFLGIEVYKPGVGKLLSRIEEASLENLHILEYDAVKVVNKMLPDKSLSGVHIFFPDPWPKKKHHKRRLVKEPFLTEVLDRLASGGYLYIVTDWKPYAEHIENVLQQNPLIYRENQVIPDWRPETAFERKGLQKNHNIFEFYYIRI